MFRREFESRDKRLSDPSESSPLHENGLVPRVRPKRVQNVQYSCATAPKAAKPPGVEYARQISAINAVAPDHGAPKAMSRHGRIHHRPWCPDG